MCPDSEANQALTAFSGSERLTQSARTASRVIDGRAVVITIDANELHILNPVGSRVWELADGRSLTQLVDEIVREFEVDPPRAKNDVYRFVHELQSVGALQVDDSQ